MAKKKQDKKSRPLAEDLEDFLGWFNQPPELVEEDLDDLDDLEDLVQFSLLQEYIKGKYD